MMLGSDKHNDMCEGEIYGRRWEMGQVLITATGVSLNSTQTLGSFIIQASNCYEYPSKPWRPSHMTSTWLVTWLTHGWSHGWHMVGHMVYHMTKVTWHHMTWLGLPTPTSRDIPIHLEDPEPQSINITSYFQIFHQSEALCASPHLLYQPIGTVPDIR